MTDSTDNETVASIPVTPKSYALGFSTFIAGVVTLWNFVILFRGWVVASQAEVAGATIFFFFLGVAPWIGILGAVRRRIWGPRIILGCALVATTGFLLIKIDEWWKPLIVASITCAPTFAVGLALRRCITSDAATGT